MRITVSRLPWRRWHLPGRLCAGLAACLLTGCISVTFDLTDIEEPVMLNALPYPESGWQATELENFTAEVSYSRDGVSDSVARLTGSNNEVNLEKNEQVRVFNAIGGHRDRALSVRSIEVWAGGFHLFFVHSAQATVKVYADVVEIQQGIEPGEADAR